MAGTEDLQAFLEERLIAFDPDIDLSDGSPAQIDIIDPTVERFEPDPFEIDTRTFISERLRQEFEDELSTEEGEALADLLIKPMEALLDPIIREVTFLRNNQSLQSPELLAPAEADSLMGNLFVRRSKGDRSVGSVRMFFNNPTAVQISVGNQFFTSSGLNFNVTTPQEISAEAMLFNKSGNLFYFDVSVEAEKEGDEYNVAANEVTGVTNVPAAVRVTNLTRMRDGVPEETTTSFLERGEASLTERSLVVPRGVLARLFDQFGDLQHLQVVGFNDPEMERDIIKGGGLGPIVIFASDGQTTDNGDGDGFTDVFESQGGGFIVKIGPIGKLINKKFTLTVGADDFDIVEVISDKRVKITGPKGVAPELNDSLTAQDFYIRQNLLTLSDIPGGIVEPNGPNGEIVIEADEVHIGGSSDFYVRGTELVEAELVISAISDEKPVVEGTDLETKAVGFPTDIVRATTTDFVAEKVRTGMTLVLETGGDAGSFQILKINPRGTDPKELQVDPAPTNPATKIRFRVVDEIDVDLNEPKTVRGSGNDLKTIQGSVQVSTVSAQDFTGLGSAAGDTLRISGDTINKGDFQVEKISGTGNKIIDLDSQMRRTSSSEEWLLFLKGDGLELPLVRVREIEILDSSKQSTGDNIPFADPVDIQSFAFSNIGVGEKKTVTDAKIGILSSVNLAGGPPAGINSKTLQISINDGTAVTVTFTGVLTSQDIVDQINNALSAVYAELITDGAEQFLSIRSTNNWLKVLRAGTANTTLGFSIIFDDDNRQIISEDVPNWTVFNVTGVLDVAYILTGDNVGFWFLHFVEIHPSTSRLIVSMVDEKGRAVFPNTDTAATVRVGSRSFGKVRCYFLEPTSFEVRGAYHRAALATATHSPNKIFGTLLADEEPRTEFILDVFDDNTTFQRFFPDPELKHQVLPSESEDVPDNLLVTSGSNVLESEITLVLAPGRFSRSSEIDFLLREILPGDVIEVTFQPIESTVVDLRPDPTGDIVYPTDVVGKTLIFSLENGPNRTVTFTNDVDGPDRLVSEINNQLGETLAFVEDTGTVKLLRLEADIAFELKSSGTAMATLGLVASDNDANAKGQYTITDVGFISGAVSNHMRLTTSTTFTLAQDGGAQHFKIKRPGVQRISATEMDTQKEGALFFADIELVSFGPGNEFNIDPDEQLSVENHKSDGYRLTVEDENLSFSTFEKVSMKVSRRILNVGSTDSPSNMTQLSGQNIQLNYDRSELIDQVQAFATSELDRVLTASIVVRHLTPHFVQFELTYAGGSRAEIVEDDIEDLINGLLPDELLEASAVQEKPRRRGAERVEGPLTLIGIVHHQDRTVIAERSQDAISFGRLATFIPDELDIERETT